MNDETPDFMTLFAGSGVLEGPTWDGRNGLYYTNVTLGGVHHLDLTTRTTSCVVEYRKGIGGLALTEAGDFVVSGRNITLKRRAGGGQEVLFSADNLGHPVIGFNDLAVTPTGTLAVGALGPGSLNPHAVDGRAAVPATGEATGRIYEIARGRSRLLADDIGHPNGIAFSPDGQTAYASDSLRRCVYRFRVTAEGWDQRAVFVQFDTGLPDGMTVASDGSIWLALALEAGIVVLDPGGTILKRYVTPVPLTTSVRFGGEDLRTVFVTTGSHAGSHAGDEAARILCFASPVHGIAARPASL